MMNQQRNVFTKIYRWRLQCRNFAYGMDQNKAALDMLSKHFDINQSVAEYIVIKHPVVKKLDERNVNNLIQTVYELGFNKHILINEPQLFGILPVTIKFRYQVLEECGVKNIAPEILSTYLSIIKKKTIGELKQSNILPVTLNIENKLASYMTQWPTSLTSSIWGNVNKLSLFDLRLKIIQRYLELMLDLTNEEFCRGIATYPTVKHRPLAVINETLTILQSQLCMPLQKIKSNLYLIHADPDNLKQILTKLRYIGGIDVKEVMRMHPKIAMQNYNNLVQIVKVLKEYNIDDEAQRRCFDIFTLSSETVRDRLEKAKNIPEFNTFYKHPRFLKMIHYNNTAMKRLQKLYNSNKKCLSLNILSGSSAHYETFEKAPGDRLGKGKDLIFCISQSLGNRYKSYEIRSVIKRHPFWINIPLVQVKYVYQQLSKEFSSNEIYENCPILLYPWNKIKDILKMFDVKDNHQRFVYFENIDLSNLSKSQILSLALYALEKKHYFTGNGVWTEEKK